MAGEFAGKTVMVLGASSADGVGWVTAQRFARQGAHVIAVGRRAEPLDKLAQSIGGTALAGDVSDEAGMLAMANSLQAKGVRLHAIVNAVGQVVSGTLETSDTSHMQAAMATEFYGNFFLFKYLSPLVVDGGAIVSISSLSATHYVPGVLPYAIAKEVPLGRAAAADEIAAAAGWLCHPDCFMTGVRVPVDGGNHLRRAPFPDEMPRRPSMH